jgi:hypothetical protein
MKDNTIGITDIKGAKSPGSSIGLKGTQGSALSNGGVNQMRSNSLNIKREVSSSPATKKKE